MKSTDKTICDQLALEFMNHIKNDQRHLRSADLLFMYSPSLKQLCFLTGRAVYLPEPAGNIKLLYSLSDLPEVFRIIKPDSNCIFFGREEYAADHPQSALSIFYDQLLMRISFYRDLLGIAYILLYQDYPYVEQLIKAGFAKILIDFLTNVIRDERTTDGIKKRVDDFEEYFMEGSDISAITGLKRKQWQLLLKYADSYRMWINYSVFIQINEITDRYLEKMLRIDRYYGRLVYDYEELLAYHDENGPFYTMKSLLSYLGSLFLKQHLDPEPAVMYLRDYLNMCVMMNIKPKIRSMSLVKDHNEVVRIYNNQQALAKASAFKEVFGRQKRKTVRLSLLRRRQAFYQAS